MGVDHARDRDPAPRELLDDHRVGRQIQPHAAVLLGDRHPEQPQLLHLLDDRSGKLVLVVVVLGVRQDLLVGELTHHLGDRLLLVGLLAVGGGYGHLNAPRSFRARPSARPAARRPLGRLRHPLRENTGMNFAREILDHTPVGPRARRARARRRAPRVGLRRGARAQRAWRGAARARDAAATS